MRGDCFFVDKAEMSRRHGAAGISILNYEQYGNQLIKMDVRTVAGQMVVISYELKRHLVFYLPTNQS